jgi:hypothetical protein
MAKTETCKKVYVAEDGTETRSVQAGADRLEFRFVNGSTYTVKPDMVPDHIREAAMWHGLSQKLGDAYGGRGKDKTLDDKVGAFEEMLGQLQEGDWITAAEGGAPRVSLLGLAYFRAMRENGSDMTEAEALEAVKSWPDDKKKAARNVAAIEAHIAAISAERAAERAAKAAEKAKAAQDDSEAPSLDSL